MGQRYNPKVERSADRWNDVFEALAAAPRRWLLAALLAADQGEPVQLPSAAADASADPERLRLELYHRHLPMLAEGGFVEWETEPMVATRGPNFPAVATVLAALDSGTAVAPDSLDVVGRDRAAGHRIDSGQF